MMMNVKLKILSSLAKVFADEEPMEYPETGRPSGFKNETISFQAAYMADELYWNNFAVIDVESPIRDLIRVRKVELVPVGFATFIDADDNYLRRTPGMYPDLLSELDGGIIRLRGGQWRSVWIDIEPREDTVAGVYPVKVTIKTPEGETCAERSANVEILDECLPRQELRHAKWFHTDCLAQYYNVPVFSVRHWEIIENFMTLAVKRGINMILTPTFTPPLDTAVGGERLTTQLVDVTLDGGIYTFGFDKLKKWVDMCKHVGVEYYEISHLFTQWGAKCAPKVMASVDGVYKKLFGWETVATSDEYKRFLGEYLTALTDRLKEWGIAGRCYFHISDEPSVEHLKDYIAAKEIVAPYLEGFEIIDALSDFEFYKSGALTKPIPANNHIHPFIDGGVEGLWTYYCVGQYKDVSNLFMAMPSARNRIFGVQLYKYDIEGILQWGYNFYNTQYSVDRVNPYAVTDADGFAPSGDAFQVYPGRDGNPEESIRIMVTAQALYDLRAFKMLESLTDKAFVMQLIEEGLSEPITFYSYPKSDVYLLNLRNRVNKEIMARICK
jgi:hypothetical protein